MMVTNIELVNHPTSRFGVTVSSSAARNNVWSIVKSPSRCGNCRSKLTIGKRLWRSGGSGTLSKQRDLRHASPFVKLFALPGCTSLGSRVSAKRESEIRLSFRTVPGIYADFLRARSRRAVQAGIDATGFLDPPAGRTTPAEYPARPYPDPLFARYKQSRL